MKKKRLTKSTRKFIRFEKARIRREISDSKEQERLIDELYKRVLNIAKKKPVISDK